MKLKVEMIQEDIDGFRERMSAGWPTYRAATCPVAHAITRAAGMEARVGAILWGFPEGSPRSARLPLQVSCWIRAFDRGEEVSPITFELDLQAAEVE